MKGVKSKMKKQFTADEKMTYHKERVNTPGVSDNKKKYSRNWLDGFSDTHAKWNLPAMENEFENRKKNIASDESKLVKERKALKEFKTTSWLSFKPYIVGAKEQLKNTNQKHSSISSKKK